MRMGKAFRSHKQSPGFQHCMNLHELQWENHKARVLRVIGSQGPPQNSSLLHYVIVQMKPLTYCLLGRPQSILVLVIIKYIEIHKRLVVYGCFSRQLFDSDGFIVSAVPSIRNKNGLRASPGSLAFLNHTVRNYKVLLCKIGCHNT